MQIPDEVLVVAALKYDASSRFDRLQWMSIETTQRDAICKVYEDILAKAEMYEDSNQSVIDMNYIKRGDNFIIHAKFNDYYVNYDCRWTKGGHSTC